MKTVNERACESCGGACCKAFYLAPLTQDLKQLFETLWWLMPWRILKDRGALLKSIQHRLHNVKFAIHGLLFRPMLVRVKDPWFLGRGSGRNYAVTCRLFRNGKCSIYGWLGDNIRPEYCRTFTCYGQPERYVYKQYVKEVM